MKKYMEYMNEPSIEKPKKIVKWFYYSRGKAYGPFDDKPTGHEILESVCVNTDEINAYREEKRKIYREGHEQWEADLRKEYSYLSDEVYDVCYQKAYEDEQDDYDEVVDAMEDVVEFAQKVIEASKK